MVWQVLAAGGKQNVQAGDVTDENLTHSDQIKLAEGDAQMGDVFGSTDAETNNLMRNGNGRGIIGFAGSSTASADLLHTAPVITNSSGSGKIHFLTMD